MYIFFVVSVTCTLQVLRALVHGRVCMLYRCVFYTNVHICEHTLCRLCTYVYMYICVHVHAYVYGCVCASMILLDTLRLVTKIFDLYIRVSACSWLALVTGVGGYALAGVEIGVLSCTFLYFCGC